MAIITDLSQLDLNLTYSYADYLTWRFEQAVELIRGKIMPMSPAPKTKHQRISWKISKQLMVYLEGKSCEAFTAPFDVRLYDRKKSVKANKDIFTVVQPDLCVICDGKKIDENGCLGAPDLVIEILSKGNSKSKLRIKYDLYEECGVLEYWIADPDHESIHQFVLENGAFRLVRIWTDGEEMPSSVFPDLLLNVDHVFAQQNMTNE